MDFEQVAPRRSEAADGTVVELLDRHHAAMDGPRGRWLVELSPGPDQDWLAVTVYADSLLRAGGEPDERSEERALHDMVEGLRAMRIRVRVTRAMGDGEVVTPISSDDEAPGGP
jgi:hypothetical protein